MKTVKIGNQEWMAENLNVSTFRKADPIPEVKSDEDWEIARDFGKPACCYYENDQANGAIYGRLYNWYAVADPRGLEPKGWHVASDTEWETLVEYLGGEEDAGWKIKEMGTAHWDSPNTAVTNESGFCALPGGCAVTTMVLSTLWVGTPYFGLLLNTLVMLRGTGFSLLFIQGSSMAAEARRMVFRFAVSGVDNCRD
jgi:uncharacterized protein (TIGR02145 family)